jgi:hypothetical protein
MHAVSFAKVNLQFMKYKSPGRNFIMEEVMSPVSDM